MILQPESSGEINFRFMIQVQPQCIELVYNQLVLNYEKVIFKYWIFLAHHVCLMYDNTE